MTSCAHRQSTVTPTASRRSQPLLERSRNKVIRCLNLWDSARDVYRGSNTTNSDSAKSTTSSRPTRTSPAVVGRSLSLHYIRMLHIIKLTLDTMFICQICYFRRNMSANFSPICSIDKAILSCLQIQRKDSYTAPAKERRKKDK
ncbi:hypothetical protein PAXRUDRAFT_643970 [Paxillus rubicundulus Ve08.2h10]|uniref:Uncharacterized protein n=1 Tax=Paxillus rubicundulus Ve08.2h10 TaxID=930991 RepID=A0A0D0D3T0_9AGAM|nr:hypothetical protein PAXRUDRAFT_643970 [Paxillus rubicundulus Ve08.2h10]